MANYKVEEVEGIGPTFGEKLRSAGVTDTDGLLNATKTKKQRTELAEKTGIPEKNILKWANMVDLFRINGVGSEYSELLEAAGVDTVPELAQRVPGNLAAKILDVNDAKKLTRKVPTEKDIAAWVSEAKLLPRMIEH